MNSIPLPPNDGRVCAVTREHILSIRTHRGAWTAMQLHQLGIAWPPKAGWLREWKDGTLITISAWECAASEAGKKVKYDKPWDPMKSLSKELKRKQRHD